MKRKPFRPAHRLIVLWLALALTRFTAALAAPGGELDPSFGDTGRILIPGGEGYVLAEQPADGKLLVGGSVPDTDDPDAWERPDFAVWRTSADGALDDSFGDQGLVTIDFLNGYDVLAGLMLQQDGRIVVAGTTTDIDEWDGGWGTSEIALARLNPDGTLDASFGDNGRASFDLVPVFRGVYSAMLDDAGRIIVLGMAAKLISSDGDTAIGDTDALVARFTTNGALDTGFGTGSVAGTTVIDSSVDDEPGGLLLQADGKYIACGAYYYAAGPVGGWDGGMMAYRLNSDGTPDDSFGAAGLWLGDAFGGLWPGNAPCLELDDGGIIIAGRAGWNNALSIYALRADGRLDTSRWYSGLKVLEGTFSSFGAVAMTLLDNGSLVLAGTADDGYVRTGNGRIASDSDLQIFQFDVQSGQLVSAFGNQGTTIVDVGAGDTAAYVRTAERGLLQTRDGKLVAASAVRYTVPNDSDSATNKLALVRVDPNGDGSAGFVGLTNAAIRVREGFSLVPLNALEEPLISVQRTGGSQGPITVDYALSTGTASFYDFARGAGTLAWADGDMEPKYIDLNLFDDKLVEGDESLLIRLSSASAPLARSQMTVWIVDNDIAEPPYTGPAKGSGGGAFGADLLLLLVSVLLYRSLRQVNTFTVARDQAGSGP